MGLKILSRVVRIVPWLAVSGLAACGASDAPPGPLSRHFDDMYIASIAMDQQAASLQAQHDYSVAKAENAHAQSELDEATTNLTVARNNAKATRIAVDTANTQNKSATASGDMNRENQAQRDLKTAQDLSKAADSHVHYIEGYRAYLARVQRFALENMYWREAQFELAKAQLAQKNNIQPHNVQYDWYPKQADERKTRTAHAKQRADAEKAHVTTLRDQWIKMQADADRENGHPSSEYDPLATKPEPAAPPPTDTPAPEPAAQE